MNDSRQIYSKSLKKTLVKDHEDSVQRSLDSKPNAPDSLKKFLTDGHGESHIVLPFEQPVYFPANFRSALSKDYLTVVDLFKDGVELHNKYLVGCRFPDDAVEWFNEPDICEFQSRLYKHFSRIGKALAYKKRRNSAYEAQLFLFKNVTSPLDDFTWKAGSRLNFLIEHSIDLLVQSYLSCFVSKSINAYSNAILSCETTIDFNNLCKTPIEARFLDDQIRLYNLRDYVLLEEAVKEVSQGLRPNKTDPSMSNEDLLFDIYELIPLYINSWSPDKNKVLLNNQFAVYLMMDYGFPSFVIGCDNDNAVNLATSTFRFSWTITNELRCAGKLDIDPSAINSLGDFILREFHDKLLSLFAIRKTKTKKDEPIECVYEYMYEVADFTTNYHQVLSKNEGIEASYDSKARSDNIPSMMMSSFFTFMQKEFNCNVDNGKGSEMKIWRSGSKIYTLGRHKQDQKIPSLLVKKILKRLGITAEEWLNSLKNS